MLDELADIIHGREPEAVSSPVRGADDAPQPSVPTPITPATKPVKAATDDSPKLSEAIAQFTAEKLRANAWGEHEQSHNELVFNEFIKIVGDVRIRRFDAKLAMKYEQRPLDEGRLPISTINKRFGRVGTLTPISISLYQCFDNNYRQSDVSCLNS